MLTATVLMLLIMAHMGTLQDARNLARNQALSNLLKAAQTALEEASLRDAATGLPNRTGFEHQVRRSSTRPATRC